MSRMWILVTTMPPHRGVLVVLALVQMALAPGCRSRAVGVLDDACCEADRPALSVCGNGITEPPEQCDDGNTLGGDGCDESCRIDDCEPAPEECNGEDDDCDGVADNGGVCSCDNPLALAVVHRETVPGTGSAADVSLVWTGGEYGAVWTSGFARLDVGGRLLESLPSAMFMGSDTADLAYVEGLERYLFCWSHMWEEICGSKGSGMSETDITVAVSRDPPEASYNNPRLAYNDNRRELALVYPTQMFLFQHNLLLLDTSLDTVVGPVDAAEHLALGISFTALAWIGDRYAFVYMASDETLFLSLFSEAGVRLGPDVPLLQPLDLHYLGNLLWDGTSFRLTWSNLDDVFYLRFDPLGQIEAESQVTHNDGSERAHAPMTALGPWTGLVWHDLVGGLDGVNRLYFTVLDDDGVPLRDPILISEHGIYGWLASNGETYVLGWREGEDVWDPDIAFCHLGCP